ncbi:MAG: DUF3106 domain-containing protein [Candidatus Diapherotrites archaeon]|nr:DUF3106 domain-containing protein [Candidatus Diapherotrites archaeon]
MENSRFAIGVFSAILVAVSPVFLAGVSPVSLGAFLIPNLNVWWSYAIAIVPAIFLTLVAAVLLKGFVSDRNARILFWTAGALTGFALFVFLGIPIVPGVFLFATYLGGYLPLLSDDPCKRGVWKTATAPKSLGALLVFIVVYFVASGSAQTLDQQFVNQVVQLSLTSAGSGPTIDVNSIISPNITPEERERLIERVQADTPDWNQLTAEQRQQLIDNYLKAYEQTKKIIYETLVQSIHVPDKNTMAAALKKQVKTMPIMQQIMKYIPAIVGFSVTIYYTLVEFLAEIAAFVVGLPLVWLLRRAMKHS